MRGRISRPTTFTSTSKPVFRPGDVVYVNLDPTKGAEKSKVRPCLVLEAGASPLPLVIVLPITEDNGRRGRLFVPIGDYSGAGLAKPSAVDCYQIRCLDVERLDARVGEVTEDVLEKVRRTLAIILDIGKEHVT